MQRFQLVKLQKGVLSILFVFFILLKPKRFVGIWECVFSYWYGIIFSCKRTWGEAVIPKNVNQLDRIVQHFFMQYIHEKGEKKAAKKHEMMTKNKNVSP